MVHAIRNSQTSLIKSTLEEKLGSGKTIQQIHAANFFTADIGEGNKSDPLAYVSRTHTRGNWLLENNAAEYWHANRAICLPACIAWTDYYRMDRITFGVAFTMHDQNMADHASYWSANTTALGNQLNQYNTEINPAIRNWESQVQNYNNLYTAWQTQAQSLKAQAKQDYEQSLADLETRKQAWLNKISQEYQDGVAKWQSLEGQIQSSRASGDLSSIQTNFQSSVSGIGVSDFSTGTSSVLANYNQSFNNLTNQTFTFTEVSVSQQPSGPLFTGPGYGNTWPAKNDGLFASVAKGIVSSIDSIAPDSFKLSGIAEKLGITSQKESITETTRTYNIFSAANDKKVETSLNIKDKDLGSIFQNTANGVFQFSQLLSTNENNASAAIREQEKLINQMTYGIRWEDRAVGQYDKDGNFVGEEYLKGYLAVLQKEKNATAKYNISLEQVNAELKKRGYEYQDGMIVKSFTDRETLIKLGLTTGLTLTEDEKRNVGSCYVNPSSCSQLRQDYVADFNKDTLQVTLTKRISNGAIGGRDANGKYISGTQVEKRTVNLSMVAPVGAPKGKDLFDVWGDDDWQEFSTQANNVMNDFYTQKLTKDQSTMVSAIGSISAVEDHNNKKFQAAKKAQEDQDSLIKDLIIAYISGGMAGVKGAIKNKVEDQINTGLAEAWARATGADDDQIAMLSQAVSFMRGKVQERRIKTRSNSFSVNDPIRSLENAFSKTYTAFNSAVSQIPVFGGIASGINNIYMGAVSGITRAAVGNKAFDKKMDQINGPKQRLAEIKANTESMIQSNVTQAVAKATGLPNEVIGNMITDYKGSQAAKKVRRAVNANPLNAIGSQVYGVIGGIVKTAGNAFGLKDRDIQRALKDGNSLMFAGNLETSWAEIQTEAYANRMVGLSAPGMSYTSATPTLKNKEGLVKELGQRAAVDFLAQGRSKEEKEIINAAFRKEYSNREQKKADKKQQAEAIRTTVITAVTTAVTLGAAAAVTGPMAAVGNALKAVGQFVGATTKAAVQVGAAIVKGAVQVVDGSRNGLEGMAAGFVNGAIGVLTAGTFDANAMLKPMADFVQSTGLGVGVTYDRKNKWGGSLGIGSSAANASITFSQRGDTSLSAGVQGATANYNLTRSSYDVGYTYNAGGGVSLTANYNSNSGLSGTVGFNRDGVGVNYRIDRTGGTAGASLSGISLGTNGPNGFTPSEIDWVEQNLDQARNNVDAILEARGKAAEDKYLRDKKVKPEEIANMTPEQRRARIHAFAEKEDNDPSTNLAAGTSRLSSFSRFAGGFTDATANIFNFYNGNALSSESMYVDSSGKVHPRTCFTAGTKIHTISGLKNIEDIQVGDVVSSWNENTGEVSYKKVTELFIHEIELLFLIEINSSENIETTWNHPFWVINRDSWVEAKDLKEGDRVLLKSGTESRVTGVSSYNVTSTKVYNFEVEENHTYFVGTEGVLVHNYEVS